MTTARFSVPLLQVGQAQKELTHNEGLQALENAVQPVVQGAPLDVPPSTPATGDQHLVGSTPQGEFAGHGGDLATWTEGGWRFLTPRLFTSAVDQLSGLTWTFDDGEWRSGIVRAAEISIGGKTVLSVQQPAISQPATGAVIDQEARYAIGEMLTALRKHGIIAT